MGSTCFYFFYLSMNRICFSIFCFQLHHEILMKGTSVLLHPCWRLYVENSYHYQPKRIASSMMKSSKVYGVRGKQVFLTFTAVICTAILIWAWERTPLVATLLPSQQNFNFRPAGTPKGDLLMDEKSYHYEENDLSNATTELRNEKAQQVVNLDLSNATTMLPKNEKEEQALDVEPSNSTIVLPRNEQVLNAPGVASVGSLVQSSTENKKEIEKGILESADEKECNYAKGKWVPDDRRPLYSGFQCKQWLSEMWACRIMQRIDFSYESFRWQPEECQMPEFESSNFLRRMKNKTIALVGDSLGRQQFQSLMCMATAGVFSPDVQDVGREYGLVKARGAIRPDGWVYRFPNTNTTILYYWSASLCELEPLNVSNPMTSYAMHLDRPAQFLRNYLHKFDVLVLNTGHHWNRGKLIANRWEMFAGGSPVKDGKLSIISNARNFAVHSVIKWLDSELPRHPRLKAFFRTLSPRHFANGDWNTGGSCDNITPLAGGNQVSANVSYDVPAETATKGTRVKLLDITALSQLRDESHISKYSVKASTGVHDCLHWCLPGIPDAWNEILFAQI